MLDSPLSILKSLSLTPLPHTPTQYYRFFYVWNQMNVIAHYSLVHLVYLDCIIILYYCLIFLQPLIYLHDKPRNPIPLWRATTLQCSIFSDWVPNILIWLKIMPSGFYEIILKMDLRYISTDVYIFSWEKKRSFEK